MNQNFMSLEIPAFKNCLKLFLLLMLGVSNITSAANHSIFDFVLDPIGSKTDKESTDDGVPFAEVISDADTLAGFFTIYHMEKSDEAWLEISPDMLDREYILHATHESGIGAYGLIAGLPARHFIFKFEKHGERIHMIRQNLSFRAIDGATDQESVRKSVANHPLKHLEIKSQAHPENESWLVSLDDIFKTDLLSTGKWVGRRLDADYSLTDNSTWYSLLKSFPENVEVGVTQTFATNSPKRGGEALDDTRSLELVQRYSICALPDDDYQPRYVDTRVGYFERSWRLWGRDDLEDPMIRTIKRWRLDKKDPDSKISEAVIPIVFWLDNAIPHEYREAFREGAMLWNIAFEQAGFKNALVIKQMPDDATWDPADIRYNVIRWISSSQPSFGAMGPSQVNPKTGEIMNADILFEADMIRRNSWGWRSGIKPLGHEMTGGLSENAWLDLPEPGDGYFTAVEEEFKRQMEIRSVACTDVDQCDTQCRMQEFMALEAMNTGMQLTMMGTLPPGEPLPWKYVRQYLVATVAHEVGHTLGLRHNFIASRLLRFDQLNDTELTAKSGLVSSVMEYDPANVALDPAEQGDYFTRTLGPYDRWAIEWGYSEFADEESESAGLEEILARNQQDPALTYGTDEDAYDFGGWGSAVDPQIRVFDLSADEAAWSRHRLEVSRRILQLGPDQFLKKGDDLSLYRRIFYRAFGGYWNAISSLPRYIGAMHLSREPWGSDKAALAPYTAAEQRLYLDICLTALVDQSAWSVPSKYLDELGPTHKWSFDGFRGSRLDLPLHRYIASRRNSILANLLNPRRLSRVSEISARKDLEDAFSIEELFSAIQIKIWDETAPEMGARLLQRAHVGLLIEILLDQSMRVPADARLLARSYLKDIRVFSDKIGKSSRVNKEHFAEIKIKIDAALDRDFNRLWNQSKK
jgi:hypothetical protein